MLKSSIYTIFSRVIIAVCSFFSIWLIAKYLGREAVGTISLITLNITVILLFANFIGSSSIVYLVSREKVSELFSISYLWSILFSILLLLVVVFRIIKFDFAFHVVIISFVYSLISINSMILLGKENIVKFNSIQVIQSLTALIFVILFFVIHKEKDLKYFIAALYLSAIPSFIISLIFIFKEIDKIYINKKMLSTSKKMLKFGFLINIANGSQLLNYRFVYYIIDSLLGRSILGLFSLAMQITESILIVSRSIATIEYSKVSNSKDIQKSRKEVVKLLKIVTFITILFLITLQIIPTNFYIYLFGSEFSEIKKIILYLSFGILFSSMMPIYAHYFPGIGDYKTNAISSFAGLLIILLLSFILIPNLNLLGAAISVTNSYFVSLSILIYKFRHTKY